MIIPLKSNKEVWKRWYAWHPVEVEGNLVWFEWVYRKYYYDDYDGWYVYSFKE